MKLFNFIFKREAKAKPSSRFSQFFLEASNKEKKKIITEVARRANEDQRKVFYDNTPKTKTV